MLNLQPIVQPLYLRYEDTIKLAHDHLRHIENFALNSLTTPKNTASFLKGIEKHLRKFAFPSGLWV